MSVVSLLGGEGRPNVFQETCARRVAEVLSRHGFASTIFVAGEGTSSWYWTAFQFHQKEHRIEIYPKIVVMHQDEDQLYFECYMNDEFESEAALIKGFSTRLDRYLGGGTWEGPEEKGFLEVVKGKIERLFGRRETQ